MPAIGLLNEKSLHASLKEWYALPGDRFEVPVDGFVIDIVRGDLLFEIQTGNFSAIKSKLTSLANSHSVRLIYPIAEQKWIVSSGRGHGTTRRKSPKRGRLEDVFWEMVSIPRLVSNRHFSLEVLMICEEEHRWHDRKRRWRRKGWTTRERRLLDVVDRRVFEEPRDWLTFLPLGLDTFTTADLAEAIGIPRALAQKMAYSLRNAGLVEQTGKRAGANIYHITE